MGNQAVGALHQLADKRALTSSCSPLMATAANRPGPTAWPVVSFLVYGLAPVLVIQDVPHSQAHPTHAELALQRMGRR